MTKRRRKLRRLPRKLGWPLALLAALAALACGDDFRIYPGKHDFADLVIRVQPTWPDGAGSTWDDQLTDPRRLAGLELVVRGFGQALELDASDFRRLGPNGVTAVSAGSGTVRVDARVWQDGEVVVRGLLIWDFEARAGEWRLTVFREVFPPGYNVYARGPAAPNCAGPPCVRVRRFPVRADWANEPEEALWLILDRFGGDAGSGA